MYNANVKQEYINLKGRKVPANMIVAFDAIEHIEQDLQKDICLFENEDIDVLVGALGKFGYSTKINYLSIFSGYVDWCVSKGYCDKNNISGIDRSKMTTVKDGLIYSPEILSELINDMCLPLQANGIDNRTRIVAWLSWSGVPLRDMLTVREKDVDLGTATILYNGRKLQIASFAMEDFEYWLNQKVMYRYKRGAEPIDMCFNGSLLREESSEKFFIWVKAAFYEKFYKNSTKIKTTLKKIYDSGCCYRATIDIESLVFDLFSWDETWNALSQGQNKERNKRTALSVYDAWKNSKSDYINQKEGADVQEAIQTLLSNAKQKDPTTEATCIQLIELVSKLLAK